MHVQTVETIFTEEVFDFFWLCQRTMKGAGAKSFARLLQEVYRRSNSERPFSSDPIFRDAFFAYQSSFDETFNVPCITCPVQKCPETGVLHSGCKVIGLDAVSLLCNTDSGPAFHLSVPTDNSPEVDCRNDHIYDRLYIAGPAKSATGKLRIELGELARKVLKTDPLVRGDYDFATLAARFGEILQVAAYAQAVELLSSTVDGALGAENKLSRQIASFFVLVCNPQAEVLQVTNLEETQFCVKVLEKEKDGTLTVVFLDEQLHFRNIRATIVEVVRAGLQRNLAPGAAAGGGLGSGGQIVLNGIVKSLLCAIISTSKRALRVAKEAADLGVIAAEKRTAPNPSATLLGFHFTNTGEQLRYAPKFFDANKAGGAAGTGACSKKQWELQNKHKRYMHKTSGVLNVVCLHSQQSLGFMFLRENEGRSHGPMALYCFMPYMPRVVVCDTGCQCASWAITHMKRYFRRWRWLIDRLHHFPHKCKEVTNTKEFSIMRAKNDSFVEQLHAVQRALGLTMINTGQVRGMFLLQLLNFELYLKLADSAKIPESDRRWPDADEVSEVDFSHEDSDNEAPGAGEMDAQAASEEDSLEDSEEEECQAGGEFPSDEEEWLSADGGEGEESEDDDFFDLEDA
jgi:hypothetical protein